MKRPEICDRTRLARESTGMLVKDMPDKFSLYGVEVTLDAYNKYEIRTPIRQHLIPIFCKITGINEKWLISGTGQMNGGAHPPDLEELIENYTNSGKEAQEALLNMARQLPKKS